MYSFGEKNRIVLAISGAAHFDKDRELYLKYFPSGKLERAISRANQFTKNELDGKIVFELLGKIGEDDILAYRSGEKEAKNELHQKPEFPIKNVVKEVYNILSGNKKKRQNKKSFPQ